MRRVSATTRGIAGTKNAMFSAVASMRPRVMASPNRDCDVAHRVTARRRRQANLDMRERSVRRTFGAAERTDARASGRTAKPVRWSTEERLSFT